MAKGLFKRAVCPRLRNYEIVWDGLNETGSRVATGVYFYRMESDKFIKTHKMIMMK